MRKSNVRKHRTKADKPPPPCSDFPLTSHNTGYWVKRIRDKHHRFGHCGKIMNGKMQRALGDGWRDAHFIDAAAAAHGACRHLSCRIPWKLLEQTKSAVR